MASLIAYHATVSVEAEEQVTIEIDVVPPDRIRFILMESDPTSDQGGVTTIGIGAQFYISLADSEDFFVLPQTGQPQPNFAGFLGALWTQVSDLGYLGEETVEGVKTHHLQGKVGPEVRALLEFEEQQTESGTADIWIGVADSLVHRLRLVGWGETNTFTLSRFDESITITAPANPRPFEEFLEKMREMGGEPSGSPEDMGRLIEGLPAEAQECLRTKLGEEAFEELKAGTRVPTFEEMERGGECFQD